MSPPQEQQEALNQIGTRLENRGGVSDGTTAYKIVSVNGLENSVTGLANSKQDKLLNSAAAHNSTFRGKDLTAFFDSGKMSNVIANGTFDDIFIGDYINKPVVIDGTTFNTKWIVADLDYFLGTQNVTNHHVLMISESTLNHAAMKSTHDVIGGYLGSDMFQNVIPKISAAIKSAFGSTHVLNHNEGLSNATDTNLASMAGSGSNGCSTSYSRVAVDANIPNVVMYTGNTVASSSQYDVAECNRQLSLFRFIGAKALANTGWQWTRSVSNWFAYVTINNLGEIATGWSNDSDGLIQPYFLLY